MPLEDMGLLPRNYKEMTNIIAKPYGMILVVGPTGSGKTTMLHAALNHINTPEKKIWTAEDPVEITQYGLRQVQVQPKIGFDFAAAMRSFLRADPDVIMVGEMRDYETISAALTVAETGHLVLATLHTNSASQTIDRVIDVFPEHQQAQSRMQLSNALEAVVAQRLLPALKGGRLPATEILLATPAVKNTNSGII